MNASSKPLQFSSLRAVQNARSRIFVTGSDPIFRRPLPWASSARAGANLDRLWNPQVVDRLTPQLTRYHD
ncbi:MAG TPA: hypothetical protein VG710_13190 [Opitutus sp.]|nr:hypothetical protein [Opitutus sp.]